MQHLADCTFKLTEDSHWISQLFEDGQSLKRQLGSNNVFDFSIGNPLGNPPARVHKAIIELLRSNNPRMHGYTPNQGLPEVRRWVANQLNSKGRNHLVNFSEKEVILTSGAAGGLNVCLRTLIDPLDEVLVPSPFFLDYKFYINNYGGVFKPVPTTPSFNLDLSAIEAAINSKTRIVLINSPNNPTGTVYSEDEIASLAALLREKSNKLGHHIFLISDEPYRNIIYDKKETASIFNHYEQSIVITSRSKDLALAGERIGYIVVDPRCASSGTLIKALVVAQRTLGFINAPALMQRILPLIDDELADISVYQENRDILFEQLSKLGFECIKPDGAFFLFPKVPSGDDQSFVKAARKHRILLLPGTAFGAAGYFRLSFCIETQQIKNSLTAFSKLADDYFGQTITGK